MSARSFMTHRCDTERAVESAQLDPSGHPVTEIRDINTALPCYWQVRTERLILDGGKAAAIAMHNMLTPLGSDLQEQDRITHIYDRRGQTLKSETMRVLTMIRRESHLELALEEVA